MTSPGIPEWEADGIPEADTEPADAGVDHLAGPDDLSLPEHRTDGSGA